MTGRHNRVPADFGSQRIEDFFATEEDEAEETALDVQREFEFEEVWKQAQFRRAVDEEEVIILRDQVSYPIMWDEMPVHYLPLDRDRDEKWGAIMSLLLEMIYEQALRRHTMEEIEELMAELAADLEAEDEDEDTDTEEGERLTDISGVTPLKAEFLRDVGIETVEDVREMPTEDIAEITGIGPSLAEQIKDDLEQEGDR